MPPRISWRNLLPGLIALVAVLLIAAGVLVFAGVGKVRGEKLQFYVLTDQARNVMRGTEVWLAGQQIGLVDAIEFRPPSADTAQGGRVVIVVRVRKRDAEQIRRDSHVQVRAGANFIGPVVVYLTAGTPGGIPVRDGDTLRAGAQADLETAGAKMNAATAELRPLLADARTVVAQVRDPRGTVGAFLREGDRGQIARLRTHVGRFRDRFFNGNGEHASAPSVMARTSTAMARVDSIRMLLRSPKTSLGRFRRDSSLAATVAGVRDEIAELRATIARAEGTIGRYANDSALARSMAAAQREMGLLFDDIRRRPMHYVHF